MKKRWLLAIGALVLLAVAMRAAGDLPFWQRYAAALSRGSPVLPAGDIQPHLRMAGDGPRAAPRASAVDQGLAPEAVEAALAQARAQQSRALIVHRRGHRIAETFGADVGEDTLVAGGDLATLLPALAAGVLAEEGRVEASEALKAIEQQVRNNALGNWRNPWSQAARAKFSADAVPFLAAAWSPAAPEFLSQRLWQPLGAGDAWLWGADAKTARIDCCTVARLGDWMRLSDLLLGQGVREGERIVSPQWVRTLMASPEPGAAPRLKWLAEPAEIGGDELPAARDAVAIDLSPELRLWLVPSRQLAILHWASDAATARDTAIPNLLIRGIVDAHPAAIHDGQSSGVAISDLVPRH
jgi:hypothetical protein